MNIPIFRFSSLLPHWMHGLDDGLLDCDSGSSEAGGSDSAGSSTNGGSSDSDDSNSSDRDETA